LKEEQAVEIEAGKRMCGIVNSKVRMYKTGMFLAQNLKPLFIFIELDQVV
jgi:hypothetical protein